MKYKIGDKVKVKSLKWYLDNKDHNGDIIINNIFFVISFISTMQEYCSSILTISSINSDYYHVEENGFVWVDEMLECDFIQDKETKPLIDKSKFRFKIGDKCLFNDLKCVIVGYYFLHKFNYYNDSYGYLIELTDGSTLRCKLNCYFGNTFGYNEDGSKYNSKIRNKLYKNESSDLLVLDYSKATEISCTSKTSSSDWMDGVEEKEKRHDNIKSDSINNNLNIFIFKSKKKLQIETNI